MFTTLPLRAILAVIALAATVRGDTACDLTTVYEGASQFLTSLSVHASSLFDGKDSLAGMTVFVPTDKFLDDSGITMFSLGAFQGENALPVMRRHVFATDPFLDAAAIDGAAMRNYAGALFVTQTHAFASPTNLRIGAAGRPAEEGALVRRASLAGCGGVTVHIIDRLLPEPTAEINGVLYTDMERLLPVEPLKCTSLLTALQSIGGAATFLSSGPIKDFDRMVEPDPGEKVMLTVFVPNNAAFQAYETFDPPAYAQMMNDPETWRQIASLHIAKTHWSQAEGPDEMQLKTLAWCDSGPCTLAATVDDAGQAFVRPTRGEGPEAQASTHGVPFCHGIIYPIDEVLRIDDDDMVIAAEDEEVAYGEDAVGAALEPVDADAAPGADAPEAEYEYDEYADEGDEALAPRSVLEGDEPLELDGVEERGVNADYPAAVDEDYGADAPAYVTPGVDYADEDYVGDEDYADAPYAVDDEYVEDEEVADAPDAADYTDEDDADYVGDEDVADAPDDSGDADYGDYYDGDDAADAGGESDDPFVQSGEVVPTKEEWEQEREREQA